MTPSGAGRGDRTPRPHRRALSTAGPRRFPLIRLLGGHLLPTGDGFQAEAGISPAPSEKSAPAKPLTSRDFRPAGRAATRKLVPAGGACRILPAIFRPRRGIVRWCGRWGGRAVPLRGGSPAKAQGASPGQPPLRPSGRHRGGGDRCARSIARRAGGAGGRGNPPAGSGRGGQPPISPANGRKPQGASPGCRPGRRDRRRWMRRPPLVLPPRTRGPGRRQVPR